MGLVEGPAHRRGSVAFRPKDSECGVNVVRWVNVVCLRMWGECGNVVGMWYARMNAVQCVCECCHGCGGGSVTHGCGGGLFAAVLLLCK